MCTYYAVAVYYWWTVCTKWAVWRVVTCIVHVIRQEGLCSFVIPKLSSSYTPHPPYTLHVVLSFPSPLSWNFTVPWGGGGEVAHTSATTSAASQPHCLHNVHSFYSTGTLAVFLHWFCIYLQLAERSLFSRQDESWCVLFQVSQSCQIFILNFFFFFLTVLFFKWVWVSATPFLDWALGLYNYKCCGGTRRQLSGPLCHPIHWGDFCYSDLPHFHLRSCEEAYAGEWK